MEEEKQQELASKKEKVVLQKAILDSFQEQYQIETDFDEEDAKRQIKKQKTMLPTLETICTFIFLGIVIFLTIVIVKNVLDLGQYARKVHVVLEYFVYIVSCILLFVFLYFPLIRMASFPYLCDHHSGKKARLHNAKVLQKIAKHCLPKETIHKMKHLPKKYRNQFCYQEVCHYFSSPEYKKGIKEIILKHSKRTFISTSISQRDFLDTIFVIFEGFRLIYEIFSYSGFRPSIIRLTKLAVRILAASFYAYEINGIDSLSLFDNKVWNVSQKISINLSALHCVSESVLDGIQNSFCMMKIGIITRNYLCYEIQWNTPNKSKLKDFFLSTAECIELFAESIFDPLGKLAKKVVEKVIHGFEKNEKSEDELTIS
jgi:uncharacterized membrane protein YcjF (UPF0283 family)